MRSFLGRLRNLIFRFIFLKRIEIRVESSLMLQAELMHRSNIGRANEILADIRRAEFKVFSQWGDDGIIQFLIEYLHISNKKFVEFGVENYQEANTRYLLINNHWKGLVLDGSGSNIREIQNQELYWRYDITAEYAFVTKENINDLLSKNGFVGPIGLLSIDIDGNDYWIWESIEVIDPSIVIIEYNALFGEKKAIAVPYQDDFNRTRAHYSNLYFGASIAALCHLAKKKGYSFIGCTSSGNNAYFVKDGSIKDLKVRSEQECYVASFSRESRNEKGKLSFVSGDERFELIKGLEVVNVQTGDTENL